MTVAAAIVAPLVLLYQGWTYYVFRARVTGKATDTEAGAGAVVAGTGGSAAG
jgi:cytochrome d ubiquinol oxidase subunit II